RLKRIVPTEKTVELHGHIIANIHYMEDILKEGIPREDMETCMRVLEQMSANLAGNEKDRGKETTKHE
ncbi:MAG TPA: MarR family transcriptional regulator, partial [Candidatus Anaerobutyricum stercoripullorum]|nr:MarR family transcriptional regulator [Candidatus Anaerobutyricum stercoripullorum]